MRVIEFAKVLLVKSRFGQTTFKPKSEAIRNTICFRLLAGVMNYYMNQKYCVVLDHAQVCHSFESTYEQDVKRRRAIDSPSAFRVVQQNLENQIGLHIHQDFELLEDPPLGNPRVALGGGQLALTANNLALAGTRAQSVPPTPRGPAPLLLTPRGPAPPTCAGSSSSVISDAASMPDETASEKQSAPVPLSQTEKNRLRPKMDLLSKEIKNAVKVRDALEYQKGKSQEDIAALTELRKLIARAKTSTNKIENQLDGIDVTRSEHTASKEEAFADVNKLINAAAICSRRLKKLVQASQASEA